MIREIEILELEKVVHLGQEFAQTKGKDFNSHWFVFLWTSILSAKTGVILGLFDDDQCYGALCAVRDKDSITGEYAASEIHWFLDSQRRGKGILLFNAFEDWAKKNGCKTLRVGRLIDSSIIIERFYQKRGYIPKEVVYERIS